MSVLDSWEAEANKNISTLKKIGWTANEEYAEIYYNAERILVLIDLVRKKDDILNLILNGTFQTENKQVTDMINSKVLGPVHLRAKEALALSEELK